MVFREDGGGEIALQPRVKSISDERSVYERQTFRQQGLNKIAVPQIVAVRQPNADQTFDGPGWIHPCLVLQFWDYDQRRFSLSDSLADCVIE